MEKTENICHSRMRPELCQQSSVSLPEGRRQCFLVSKIMTPGPAICPRGSEPGGRPITLSGARSPPGEGALSSQAAFCQADNCKLSPRRERTLPGSLLMQTPEDRMPEPGRASEAWGSPFRESAVAVAEGAPRGLWAGEGAPVFVCLEQTQTQGGTGLGKPPALPSPRLLPTTLGAPSIGTLCSASAVASGGQRQGRPLN